MLFRSGLIPGMPKMPFLLLPFGSGVVAYKAFKTLQRVEETKEEPPVEVAESIEALLPLDPLEIEMGYSLVPLVDAGKGGELLERIKALRRQMAVEMGFVMPRVHIRDNLQIKPGEYIVKLKGVEVAGGEIEMAIIWQ